MSEPKRTQTLIALHVTANELQFLGALCEGFMARHKDEENMFDYETAREAHEKCIRTITSAIMEDQSIFDEMMGSLQCSERDALRKVAQSGKTHWEGCGEVHPECRPDEKP